MFDNAPSVGIVRCSKHPVDAREKNIQQRAKSLSLAGAGTEGTEQADACGRENLQSFGGKIFPAIPWKISLEKDEMRDLV